MYKLEELKTRDSTPDEDHIVVLRGATWADFERLLEIRGDNAAPRMAYTDGLLELMSPSRSHEHYKSIIGCLVEVWCLENDVDFTTLGAWLLKESLKEKGLEPDECYVFGPKSADAERPDLAIEVVWTSGGINKLKIYAELGVQEVWYFEKGVITPYELVDGQYQELEQSRVLSGIDLEQLVQFIDRETTSQAMREFRAALER